MLLGQAALEMNFSISQYILLVFTNKILYSTYYFYHQKYNIDLVKFMGS